MKLKRAAALLLMLTLSVQTVAGTAFAAELSEEAVETESQSAEETLEAIQETAEESVSEEIRELISEETEELHTSDTEDGAEDVEEDAAAEAEKETEIETWLGQVSDEMYAEPEESVSAEESDIAEQTAIVEEGTITETEAVSVLNEETAEETAEETGMELYAVSSVASSGVCGDNLTWTLDSDGVLTISGTGDMYDWDWLEQGVSTEPTGDNFSPWYESSIRSVVIEEGVTSIGDNAFPYCRDLKTVSIPEGVTRIGDDAFFLCASLENVDIPSTVVSIGRKAFQQCVSLTYIDIPYGVTKIDDLTFYYCTGITDITIPNSVTHIGEGALAATVFTNITIPDSVISIGDMAFALSALTSVTIPDSVYEIGVGLFWYCKELTSVKWSAHVDRIMGSTFADCTGLQELIIPENIYRIDRYAFENCSNLTSVYISDRVTSIDSTAFYNCSSDLVISGYYGSKAETFANSQGITFAGIKKESSNFSGVCGNNVTWMLDSNGVLTISGTGEMYNWSWVYGSYSPWYQNESVLSVVIEEGVTGIGNEAFYSCPNLKNVTIAGSVSNIGKDAFIDCSKLENLELAYGIKSIDEGAFAFCWNLTNVNIPNSVTRIGTEAFYYCFNLASAFIPSSVLVIDENAFGHCSDNLVIYGYAGSAAETYANDNFITFMRMENVELIRAFAARCYSEVLGRDAGESELDYWQNELVTGNQTAAQVAAFFVFSDEFKEQNNDNSEFLDRLYSTFFGRSADEGGKAYWTDYLENGATRNWVTANFVNSAEFEAICADYGMQRGTIVLTDYADQNVNLTMYVYRCYTKILGRAAEEDGLEWWCERIYTGQNQATDVARAFVLSDEFVAKNLSDEGYIEVLYEAFMGRESDEAGMEYWLGLLENGWSREDVLNVFAGCQEFQDILAGFGL